MDLMFFLANKQNNYKLLSVPRLKRNATIEDMGMGNDLDSMVREVLFGMKSS